MKTTKLEAALFAIAADKRSIAMDLSRKIKIADAGVAGRCPASWAGNQAALALFALARDAARNTPEGGDANGQ